MIGRVLVNADALVGRAGVTRELPRASFACHHVEAKRGHALLLSEGVPAESYLPQRAAWAHGKNRSPRAVAEMDLPPVTSARLLRACRAA